LPDDNVFTLNRGKKKALEFYKNGILSIKDIPQTALLTERQAIQWECARNGKPHLEKEKIKEFLETLRYPLSFLDFETIGTAIPQFDSVSPYQNIPFQFSLHIVNAPHDNPVHRSFLASGSRDPRGDFLKALRQDLSDEGSIIIYNRQFEQGILLALGGVFPEYAEWISRIIKRFVDLLAPFKEYHYYNPLQGGSASLKSVLPAITGKGYNNLEIGDGMTASRAFLYMTFDELYGLKVNAEEKEAIRRNLDTYCGLDTEGMIWIIRELEKLAG
jgi:hypothetical protein